VSISSTTLASDTRDWDAPAQKSVHRHQHRGSRP